MESGQGAVKMSIGADEERPCLGGKTEPLPKV